MSDPNELPGKYRVNYGTKDTLKRNLLEREIGFCTTDKQCYIKGMAENPGEEAPLLPMGSGGSGECNLFVGDIDTSNAEWLEAYRNGKELRFKGLAGLVPEEMLDQLGPYIVPNAIHNNSVRIIANTLVVISLTIDMGDSQLYVELMQGSLGNDEISPDEYRVMEIAILLASKLPVAFHRYDPESDYPLDMVAPGTPIISFFTSAADSSYIPTAAFYGVGGSLDLLEVEMLLMGQLPDSIHDWGIVEMMHTMGVLYAMEKCGPMFLTGLYDDSEDNDSGIVEVHEKSDALSGVTGLLPAPYEFSIIDFTLITPRTSGSYGYSNEMEALAGNVSDGIAMCYMAVANHEPSLTDPEWDFEADYYIQVKVIMDRNGIFVGGEDTAYDEWMTAYNANKALFVKLEGRVVPVQFVEPKLEAMPEFTTDTWVEGLAYDQPVFRFGVTEYDAGWKYQSASVVDILPNSMWHQVVLPQSAILKLSEFSDGPRWEFAFNDNMLGESFHGTEGYGHTIAWDTWLQSVVEAFKSFGWTLYGVWNDYSRYGILLQSFGGNYHGDDNAPYGYLYAVDAEGSIDVEWYEDDGDTIFEADYGCDADTWPLYVGWDPEGPGSVTEIYFGHKEVSTVIANSTTLPVNVEPAWCSQYAVTPQYPSGFAAFEGYVYVIVPASLGNVTLTAGNLDFMVSGSTTLEAGKKYELHLMHRTLTVKELTILSQAENPYITSSSSDEDVAEYLVTDTRDLLDASADDGSVAY